MNSITFSMFGFTNWCIKTIIAQTFEPGYDGGTIRQVAEISRPDQEKGG
jgi:hypothetical protein